MITVTMIFIALYLILIRIFRVGWRSIDPFRTEGAPVDESMKVSVVIACKNEEKALPRLLEALKNQTYLSFELIMVDDHSTDQTASILQENLKSFSNALYIPASEYGKKNAVAEGILRASGELIVTTDADCRPARKWIETIVKFQTAQPSHLIICPVKLPAGKTFFSRLQQVEFTSLVASGAGAAGAGFPLMCNAANMAFTKDAWLKSRKDLKPEEPSGDDIFLLHSVKKRRGIIRFLRSEDAFVQTEPSPNLCAFFRQRRRWAGKSASYTDRTSIAVACLVLGVCLAQLFLLAASCFEIIYFYFFLFFFLLKYWADTRFLSDLGVFFALQQVPIYSFCLSAVYPFYIVFTAFSSLFFKPRKW